MASPIRESWAEAGAHALTFRPGPLPAGVYVCRLEAGERVQTRKMLLVR